MRKVEKVQGLLQTIRTLLDDDLCHIDPEFGQQYVRNVKELEMETRTFLHDDSLRQSFREHIYKLGSLAGAHAEMMKSFIVVQTLIERHLQNRGVTMSA